MGFRINNKLIKMKISLVILALIQNSGGVEIHHRAYGASRGSIKGHNKDIGMENIDPWVYDMVSPEVESTPWGRQLKLQQEDLILLILLPSLRQKPNQRRRKRKLQLSLLVSINMENSDQCMLTLMDQCSFS